MKKARLKAWLLWLLNVLNETQRQRVVVAKSG